MVIWRATRSARNPSRNGLAYPSIRPCAKRTGVMRKKKKNPPLVTQTIKVVRITTEMYHLCVQYISSRNREEIALGSLEPLDTVLEIESSVFYHPYMVELYKLSPLGVSMISQRQIWRRFKRKKIFNTVRGRNLN